MFDRSCVKGLLLVGLLAPIASCGTSPGLTSIVVTPGVMNFGGSGLTTQLTATGYYTHPGHPAESRDITDQVSWSSSTPACVSVNSTGLITSGQDVCSNIPVTASMEGFNGLISGSMTVNVTQSSGGGGTNQDITSLSIIPTTLSVASPPQTGQFVAIGTITGGTTVNLTSLVQWSSSSPSIATISKAGQATAVGKGTTDITAIYTNADGSVATATATFTVLAGASEPVTALAISPSTLTIGVSQSGQLIALGTSGTTGLSINETNSSSLVWSSSTPEIASVAAGLVTGVGPGTTNITAQWTNPDGSVLTASASVTVTGAATGTEPLLSISVLPGNITVSNKGMTGQFLAFGTYSSAPTTRDLTNQVTWISTSPEVASIDSGGAQGEVGGLATAQGYTGDSIIYAEATNPDGTVVISPSVTFTCRDSNSGICEQGVAHPQFATLTVYNAGENSTTWVMTAPSDTGTPNLIHCGPGWKGKGGSVCTGTYETGTTVVITESPTGSGFGGWSSGDGAPGVGCTPAAGKTLLNSPTCTITLSGDSTVGAIFY
jgi:hypothetical protein